jgi:hypothetical protein
LSANITPHFNVIANFILSIKAEISEIFVKVLIACHDMGLIGVELPDVDGVSSASRVRKADEISMSPTLRGR